MQVTLLPIADIDAAILPRDRAAALDEEALTRLQHSILSEGLRQPIEVFPLEGDIPWGLISGFRRLSVFRTLADIIPRFAEIPAFIRQPGSIPAVLAEMVSENELREPISPWEKAALILACVELGHFPTHDAATAGLFPYLHPVARTRLRAVLGVVQDLGPVLKDAHRYSLRQLLRLAEALEGDLGDAILAALAEPDLTTQEAQCARLDRLLAEAEATRDAPGPYRSAPRRISRPRERKGVTIRREWLPNGWRLEFTGPEATGAMIESVFAEIERMYGPPPG